MTASALRRPRESALFATAAEWVTRLAEAHHTGRLQDELRRLGRRFMQPGRPWTNGTAERLNRSLRAEWAYARPWTSNDQ